MGIESSFSSSRRAHALAALALGAVYLAVMSGHMISMDGLYMERQAYALVFEHSVRFQAPLWTWRPDPTWNSMYGIGLSLLYVPGMLAAAALRPHVPISIETPSDVYAFYLRELYQDPLYTFGAAWVHALIVAFAVYLVARLIVALRFSPRAALWGMAFYGLGSSAIVYARGDFAQPLEGLCWTAAVLAAVRFRENSQAATLAGCVVAVFYAILTRPIEGMLLLPAAIILLLPGGRPFEWRFSTLKPALAVCAGAAAGVAVTLLVNWARFGDPWTSGYDADNGWVVPTVKRWAGMLFSPGRGLLWEFPAIALVPFGVAALMRVGRRREVITILLLCAALLANTASWYMWWGGWSWGLRLFTPAIPLLAVLAGAGVDRLRGVARHVVPGLLLFGGLFWALPGVVTDILGGYGQLGDGDVWPIKAYPPYGAWQFLVRLHPRSPDDAGALDILWFRLAHLTGNWSLLVPVVLLGVAAILMLRVLRLLRVAEPTPR